MKNAVAIDHVHIRSRNIIVERKEFTAAGFALQTGALKGAEGNIKPHDKIQVEYFTQQGGSVSQPTAVIDSGTRLLTQFLKRMFQPFDPSECEIVFVLAADR